MEFNLSEHACRAPESFGAAAYEVDVAIVGGGPSGLALAYDLGRRGVRTAVLEARGKVSDGSRAILFDRQSINYLDRLGLASKFFEAADIRETNTIYFGRDEVYKTRFVKPDHEKNPQFAVLQQCYLEAIFVEALDELSDVSLRWHHAVEGIEQNADGAVLQVQSPEGNYALKARYVVAADGARGPMKRLLDLHYDSPIDASISDREFVICDFLMKTDLPKGRRMFLFPPTRPDGIMLMHAQPYNTWRLDYPLAEGENIDDELHPDRVRERIDAHLEMMAIDADYDVVWTTSYRARAACVPQMAQGRVAFVGDAAHLSPIFGGRGLNLGFADTAALGWRLADLVEGRAELSVLADYSKERVSSVMNAFSRIGQATLFITAPTAATQFLRKAVMPLAKTEDFISQLFDPHRAVRGEVLPLEVADGAIAHDMLGAQLSGIRLTAADGSEVWLQDLIGSDGIWLALGGAEIADAAPDGRPVISVGQVWKDAHGDVDALFGAAPLLLDVRPDAVIAAVYPANRRPAAA